VHVPGTGLIIAFVTITVLGFLTANLVGRRCRVRREHPQPHAVGAADLQEPKQIFEPCLEIRIELPRVGLVEFPSPGMCRWSSSRSRPAPDIAACLPTPSTVGVHALTPNPNHGFFFYVPRRDVIDLEHPRSRRR